jgi:DNA-binding MarR family transcriptional regulator
LKEARLSAALLWYDALLELSRRANGMLRPVELEKHMLLPQYSTSRLVDRLAEAGLAERKTCPIDGRGQYVVITQGGRNLQKKMWDSYSAAIERHVGAKLSNKDAASALRSAGAAGLTGCGQDCPFPAPVIKVATFFCRNPAWPATKST